MQCSLIDHQDGQQRIADVFECDGQAPRNQSDQ